MQVIARFRLDRKQGRSGLIPQEHLELSER